MTVATQRENTVADHKENKERKMGNRSNLGLYLMKVLIVDEDGIGTIQDN